MKAPYKWLKEFVDIDISPKELGDRLTLSGSKVEEIISQDEAIENVVTGKVLKIEQHPDAEKLVICQVEVNDGNVIQIVTGADNMKEGDIVPTALHGSSLPGGVKIKKGKLRGVMSNGMMCSKEELGLPDDENTHGLMILDKNTPVGKDVKLVLDELNDAVIDFEITSNRPDCFSILGIARETAATLDTQLRYPDVSVKGNLKEEIKSFLSVEVRDSLCRRYIARAVKNVKIAPSPEWMQEKLLAYGVRPINNIVDITNYVNAELGQPLHAFDKRQITSSKIVVERAVDGEKFTTLDKAERTLTSDMLCIKDGDKAVALAGVMGGLNSEVVGDTSEIIFESANFDGTNIRITSNKLGLRTEASMRYEKDLDPNLTEMAVNRACHLVELLCCGDVVDTVIDIYPEIDKEKTLTVSVSWVNKFLGTEITAEDMKKLLKRLELTVGVDEDNLIITVPTFRRDLNIKEDIAEEIARIYGYDKIVSTLSSGTSVRGGKTEKQKIEDKIINTLLLSGLNQSISYSFTSRKVFDRINIPEDSLLRNAVEIKNPLGEDFSIMRTTTIPSIMENLARNFSRNNDSARLFEIGRVYIKKTDEFDLPKEKNIITIGMYGSCDYLTLKGAVENILDALGIERYEFIREKDNSSYHPGKTAALLVNKEYAGVFGEIHPDVSDNYGVDTPCFAAELNMDLLINNAKMKKQYRSLPKFPAVTRDIALLVDDSVLVQDIHNIIKGKGGNLVESIELFDVYKGKQIAEGKKSIAYRIVYRSEDKTLTDKDVSKVHSKILSTLEFNLGAELR
jgi:phenylalanyl-tRNA synthetase beta chain